MYLGLAVSALLHLGLLAWAFVHIQSTPETRSAAPEPVAVALVTPDELTRLRQGVRNAKQLDAEAKESPKPDAQRKEAPNPRQAAAPPPAAEPPPLPKEEVKPEPQKDPIADTLAALPKEPDPPPGPSPDEKAALEAKLEAERKAEEARKAAEARKKAEDARKAAEAKKKADDARKAAEAKRRAEAKKKQFDADNISALLNKIPDKGGPAPAVEKSELPSKAKGPVAGAPEGKDTRLTASEMGLLIAAIRQGVQPCWRVLSGGQGAEATAVRMRIRFNQDGTINGEPQIMNPQSTAFFMAAAESAKRAVMQCQPYNLPQAKYAAWADVILNFDPKDMF